VAAINNFEIEFLDRCQRVQITAKVGIGQIAIRGHIGLHVIHSDHHAPTSSRQQQQQIGVRMIVTEIADHDLRATIDDHLAITETARRPRNVGVAAPLQSMAIRLVRTGLAIETGAKNRAPANMVVMIVQVDDPREWQSGNAGDRRTIADCSCIIDRIDRSDTAVPHHATTEKKAPMPTKENTPQPRFSIVYCLC